MVDLSLHLMDVIQNSIDADSTHIEVSVEAEKSKNLLTVRVKDDGKGMSPETVKKAFDPFFTGKSSREVGLGIPLLVDTAAMAGGTVRIDSVQDTGTTTTATFELENISRKPLGDLAETMALSIMGCPDIEFHLILRNEESEFVFRTEEVRKQIGEVPINDFEIISFIEQMLDEQIISIFGGILNEIIS